MAIAHALSTAAGGGSDTYINLPTSTLVGNGVWFLRIVFQSPASISTFHRVLGNTSGSGVDSLRISTSGALQLVVGGQNWVSSATGVLTPGEIHEVVIISDGTTIEMSLDGVPVASGGGTTTWILNAFNRARTSYTPGSILYELEIESDSYTDLWGTSNSPSSGLTWTGKNGNQLALVNSLATDENQWIEYDDGTGGEPVNYDVGGIGGYSIIGAGNVIRGTDVSGTGSYTINGTGGINCGAGATGNGEYTVTGTGDAQRNTNVSGVGSYTVTGQGGSVGVRNFNVGGVGEYDVTGTGGIIRGVSVGGADIYSINGQGGITRNTGVIGNGVYSITGSGNTQRNTDVNGVSSYTITGSGGFDADNEIVISITRLPVAIINDKVTQNAFNIPAALIQPTARIPGAIRWT